MTATETLTRRATRGFAASATITAVLLAGPAHADVPEGWSNPADVDMLDAILLLAGVPLLISALLALAVYLPAMIRGEKLTPGEASVDNQWFGGPREGSRELGSAEDSETGGARGSW